MKHGQIHHITHLGPVVRGMSLFFKFTRTVLYQHECRACSLMRESEWVDSHQISCITEVHIMNKHSNEPPVSSTGDGFCASRLFKTSWRRVDASGSAHSNRYYPAGAFLSLPNIGVRLTCTFFPPAAMPIMIRSVRHKFEDCSENEDQQNVRCCRRRLLSVRKSTKNWLGWA